MINLIGPPPTDSPPETITSGPTAEPRSRIDAMGWVLFGLGGAILGAAIAGFATAAAIADSTDDYAGLWLIITVPFGYIIGAIASIVAARIIEAEERSNPNQTTRTGLTFLGTASPFIAGIAGAALLGLMDSVTNELSDAAPASSTAIVEVVESVTI